MFQISPVVTGTLTDFFTCLISSIRSSIFCSPRKMVSLPTTMPLTLLLRLARLIAASISRLLRSAFLVDPGADRDLEAELGGDRRHQFDATGRGVETDRARDRGQLLQVGANLLDLRNIVDVGMGAALERRVGDARQDAPEIGGRLLFLEQAPQPGVSCGHKQQNGDDGTHRGLNHTGLQFIGSEPVP